MSTADVVQLKPKQLGALVILMAEAREVDNNELHDLAGCRLAGNEWKSLEAVGLISHSKTTNGLLAFQLTDKGWRFCRQLHEAEVNVGNSTAGRSIFVLLGGLHRSLDRLRVSHADFFKQSGTGDTAAGSQIRTSEGDVETSIRTAYDGLVSRQGQWVALADLRDRLTGFDRRAVDDALVAMAQKRGVRIIPVANVKALSDRERAAALRMGGESHHALSIGAA
jgi:hypothetical protein